MSIPVDQQSGPATKAAPSSQDQTAGGRDDMAMDVQEDAGSGGVGGKTSASSDDKKKGNEEASASDDEDASGPACPLFMSGLPSDFASNPSLAAIASLLGDEEYDSDVDVSKVRKGLRRGDRDNKTAASDGGEGAASAATVAAKPRAGGGKVGGAGASRRNRNNSGSRKKSGAHHRPYPTSDKKKSETKQKATVGEAQLFLNMWKL